MIILASILVFTGGVILGSFAVAQVWRLRAAQLNYEVESGQAVDKSEWKKLKPLISSSKLDDRSRCLHCGYKLKWYDLIPIVSWLILGGKCRKCKQPIGVLELMGEVSLALLFVISLIFWPFGDLSPLNSGWLQYVQFIIWLAALTIGLVLFIYDMKWSLLPFRAMIIFNILAGIFWLTRLYEFNFDISLVFGTLLSMLILPGIYLVLNLISKGAWVGSGDWILSIGLSFLIPPQPIFAAIVLFLANFIGSLYIVLQSVLSKVKLQRGLKIPFGPLLILATLIVFFSATVIDQLILFLV